MRYAIKEGIANCYKQMITETSTFKEFFDSDEPIEILHKTLRLKHDAPVALKQIGGNKLDLKNDMVRGVPLFWIDGDKRTYCKRQNAEAGSYFDIYIFDKNKLIEKITNRVRNPHEIMKNYMQRNSRIYKIEPTGVRPEGTFQGASDAGKTVSIDSLIKRFGGSAENWKLRIAVGVNKEMKRLHMTHQNAENYVKYTLYHTPNTYNKWSYEDISEAAAGKYNTRYAKTYSGELDNVKNAIMQKLEDESIGDEDVIKTVNDYRNYLRRSRTVFIPVEDVKEFFKLLRIDNPTIEISQNEVVVPDSFLPKYGEIVRRFAAWHLTYLKNKYTQSHDDLQNILSNL